VYDVIFGDLSDPMTWDDRWPRLHRPEAPRRRDPGRAARWIVVAVLALAWAYCWRGWRRAVLERDEARAGVSIAAKGGGR
jgi:hypothetical protein